MMLELRTKTFAISKGIKKNMLTIHLTIISQEFTHRFSMGGLKTEIMMSRGEERGNLY